jgi:hypothetical protein
MTEPPAVTEHKNDFFGRGEDGVKAVQRVMGQATPTDVLLPSGALVLAYIDGGVAGDRVSAHDGGAALAEVRQAGFAMTQQVMRAARSAAGRAGLSVEGSILRSPPEALADARVAVIILANGARAVAEAALTAARKKRPHSPEGSRLPATPPNEGTTNER